VDLVSEVIDNRLGATLAVAGPAYLVLVAEVARERAAARRLHEILVDLARAQLFHDALAPEAFQQRIAGGELERFHERPRRVVDGPAAAQARDAQQGTRVSSRLERAHQIEARFLALGAHHVRAAV